MDGGKREDEGGATAAAADRPRERLLAAGPEALSSAELIALVLRTGSPGRPAVAVARRLLERFGSVRGLAARTARELATEPGVGPARAAALVAAAEIGRRLAETRLVPGARVGGSADVFRHYHLRLRDLKRERFLALLLDGKHRLLGEVLVSEGTLTASLVHPREAFAPAIRESAAAVVFVHNHPSGDPAPSREDVELTRRLVAVGELTGVQVLDHVIVGDGRYYSFADAGRLAGP
jgi:DNA repair protein RadC